ncbi:MAG: rod shape-determining protein MreD [Candidatus Acidiferrales bacterium]
MAIKEARLEVYRFHPLVILSAVVLAILIQVSVPRYLPFVPFIALLDLALIIVIYFGFSRRNPATGLLLGLAVGILQDALSVHPIGLFGMAKTLVGYGASSLSSRIDTDPPAARLLLVFGFYHVHHFAYALIQRLLLQQPAELIGLPVLEGALVNSLLGMLVFLVLDRFRQST